MKGCKHKYTEHKGEPPNGKRGYWFRCIYCGNKVFGELL